MSNGYTIIVPSSTAIGLHRFQSEVEVKAKNEVARLTAERVVLQRRLDTALLEIKHAKDTTTTTLLTAAKQAADLQRDYDALFGHDDCVADELVDTHRQMQTKVAEAVERVDTLRHQMSRSDYTNMEHKVRAITSSDLNRALGTLTAAEHELKSEQVRLSTLATDTVLARTAVTTRPLSQLVEDVKACRVWIKVISDNQRVEECTLDFWIPYLQRCSARTAALVAVREVLNYAGQNELVMLERLLQCDGIFVHLAATNHLVKLTLTGPQWFYEPAPVSTINSLLGTYTCAPMILPRRGVPLDMVPV